MRVRVLYHDNCLDGASSAALFTAFYRQCMDQNASFEYVGVNHGVGDVFAGVFSEDANCEHVCVDFRYTRDPRLTWWFDHHHSAFSSKGDEAHFLSQENPRHFYDPKARSCTKFLVESCRTRFGFDASAYQDLIYWADLVDGAQFATPQMAVEMKEPALKLMMWVEANHSVEHKKRFIADLIARPLDEIVLLPYVQDALKPLLQEHQKTLVLMKQRMVLQGGVVNFDITQDFVRAPNKFIPYYFYPDCHYVVGISKGAGRTKISVGSNPWYAARRTVNIADLCARYGGGGHPVVGAVSFGEDQLARAQQVYQEIGLELRQAVCNEQ